MEKYKQETFDLLGNQKQTNYALNKNLKKRLYKRSFRWNFTSTTIFS